MTTDSIAAYSTPQRVAAYDADMGIMHPNREKMIRVTLDALEIQSHAECVLLDLGCGSGVLTNALLLHFPRGHVVAVDGSQRMLDLAKERAGANADRVRFLCADFRDEAALAATGHSFEAVVSSFALHHLDPKEKTDTLRAAARRLKPGGWIMNADIIVSDDPIIEGRWQTLRVEGIVARARETGDARFADFQATRDFLDALETREGDQPQPLANDLASLRAAGLAHVGVFWQETREAVYAGVKGTAV